MKLVELIVRRCIVPELESNERNGVIRELVSCLAGAELIKETSVESVVRSIVARERKRGTTGFGKGVAAPHAKIDGIDRVVAALGRSSRGVDFAALDGGRVHAVFLILSPSDQPEQHLRAMDQVFRHLQHDRFRKFLRQSESVDALYELLKEADADALAG